MVGRACFRSGFSVERLCPRTDINPGSGFCEDCSHVFPCRRKRPVSESPCREKRLHPLLDGSVGDGWLSRIRGGFQSRPPQKAVADYRHYICIYHYIGSSTI